MTVMAMRGKSAPEIIDRCFRLRWVRIRVAMMWTIEKVILHSRTHNANLWWRCLPSRFRRRTHEYRLCKGALFGQTNCSSQERVSEIRRIYSRFDGSIIIVRSSVSPPSRPRSLISDRDEMPLIALIVRAWSVCVILQGAS